MEYVFVQDSSEGKGALRWTNSVIKILSYGMIIDLWPVSTGQDPDMFLKSKLKRMFYSLKSSAADPDRFCMLTDPGFFCNSDPDQGKKNIFSKTKAKHFWGNFCFQPKSVFY